MLIGHIADLAVLSCPRRSRAHHAATGVAFAHQCTGGVNVSEERRLVAISNFYRVLAVDRFLDRERSQTFRAVDVAAWDTSRPASVTTEERRS